MVARADVDRNHHCARQVCIGHNSAALPSHYGVGYRVWGSIRGRQALRHFSAVAPRNLQGGMPGRSAPESWWQLQFEIEAALTQRRSMAGITMDLSKAFNTLPRTPVFAMALRAGLPQELVRAWSGAVSGCLRRFRIRGSVGPPLLACTGFLEGDALSVVSMVLVDLVLHAFVQRSVPAASLTTFLDDWKATAGNAEIAMQALQACESFAQVWDLALDRCKSFAWAVSPDDRRKLRLAGVPVVLAARDLGGHMTCCRRRSNFTLASRVTKLEPIWQRLQCSVSPYKHKVQALVTAAWPRALYGAALAPLGRQHFQSMRSGAMRGLNARKPGANPWLHLGLVESPVSDPGFFALRSSFRDLLSFGARDSFVSQASEIVMSADLQGSGPVTVLLARCHEVGISWDCASMAFCDMLGSFCPFSVSPQEVEARLVLQWQACVAAKVATRSGFAGVQDADPLATRALLKQLPVDDQASLRIPLNGSFFTEDMLCHIGEADLPVCPFCRARDSPMHRVWQCPCFALVRNKALQGFQVQPELLPDCQAQHAWVMQPAGLFGP